MASGGVRNKRSITFWSESRFSVKTSRRKDRNRTSSAARAAAQHTFRIRMKRRSRPPLSISISLVRRERGSAITLAKAGGDVKRCGTKGSIRCVRRGSFAKPAIIGVCDEAQKTIRQRIGKGARCRQSGSADSDSADFEFLESRARRKAKKRSRFSTALCNLLRRAMERRRSCVCTRNASPATCSHPSVAIAARNSSFRCEKLQPSLPECCSTCRRKGAESD